jgi:hypothetical protein
MGDGGLGVLRKEEGPGWAGAEPHGWEDQSALVG